MVVGAVLSVTQTDVKRLLAYSSIAHAGFILVGVLAFSQAAITGVMFYLVAYGAMTIAAFAIVTMVRQDGSEASHLSQWAGLGRNHPVVAGTFAFLLLAFAGIPLTSGFTAKFAAFAPAVQSGGTSGVVMVVVGVLASAVTAFVYVRLIVLMYFTEPVEGVVALQPSVPSTIAISLGVIVTARRRGGPGLAPPARGQRVPLPAVSAAGGVHDAAGDPLRPRAARRERRACGTGSSAGLADVEDLIAARVDHDDPFIAQASSHLTLAGGQAVPPAAHPAGLRARGGRRRPGRGGRGRRSS